jgi:putative addiction module component (TIGR02574 family)
MDTLNDIVAAAQALPSTERAQLIALLWDILSAEDWPVPSQEWIDEANRRSDALDSGKIATDSWEAVRSRAQRKAGLDG